MEQSRRNHHHHHTVKLTRKSRHQEKIKKSKSLNSLNLIGKDEMEPRMQKLETLEATMAQIAMALGHKMQPHPSEPIADHGTHLNYEEPRKAESKWHKFNKLLKEQREENKSKELSILQLKNECEQLREALKNAFNRQLTEKCNSSAEAIKKSLAIEEKKAVVKSLRLSLESCTLSETIDGQIARAELEYRLGSEELELMDMQQKFEERVGDVVEKIEDGDSVHDNSTLFSIINSEATKGNFVSLHSVELPVDSRQDGTLNMDEALGFGLKMNSKRNGFIVNNIGPTNLIRNLDLKPGDRLLEANGENMTDETMEKLQEVLKSSSQAQLVFARCQNKMKRLKDFEVFKQEMSEVVHKLDHRINENKEMHIKYEKLLRIKSSLEKNNKRQRYRISYLEDKLDAMMIGWKELRLALDEQLNEDCSTEYVDKSEYLLNNHKYNNHKNGHYDEDEEVTRAHPKGDKHWC